MVTYSDVRGHSLLRRSMSALFDAIKSGDATEAYKVFVSATDELRNVPQVQPRILDIQLEGHADFEGRHGTLRDMAREMVRMGAADASLLCLLEDAETGRVSMERNTRAQTSQVPDIPMNSVVPRPRYERARNASHTDAVTSKQRDTRTIE